MERDVAKPEQFPEGVETGRVWVDRMRSFSLYSGRG